MRLAEKARDRGGHHRADIGHLQQLFFARLHDGVKLAEVARQVFGGGLPHLPDAEAKQEARQRGVFRCLNRGDHVERGFLRHALEHGEAGDTELVQISRGFDDTGVDQLIGQLVTQAFNVERAALRKMQQRLLALRRTEQPAGTARNRLAFFTHNIRATHGAVRGHVKTVGLAPRPRRGHHHHFGNHVTGAPHNHAVAAPHVLAPHFVFVMQCGVGDGDTTDKHRLQTRHRGDGTGAAHLHLDVKHFSEFFLCRKFMRDGKARCARDKAERLLLVEAVDFVDHAVDVIRQRAAARADGAEKIEQPGCAVGHHPLAAHRQADAAIPVQ